VPGGDQLRDEPVADGAGGTGEEDAHDCSVSSGIDTETGQPERA
jgi:hypothetical protein